jgi:hypothetical protein
MPLLLEDFLEETKASGQRMARRVDQEAARLEQLRQIEASLQEIRRQVQESARQATNYAISRMPAVESAWQLALQALRADPWGESDNRILQTLLEIFESGLNLIRAVQFMWRIAAQLGNTPEQTDELIGAEQRLLLLKADAQSAIEHRASDWTPADPERLALGIELAREGKTVSADKARNWFKKPSS